MSKKKVKAISVKNPFGDNEVAKAAVYIISVNYIIELARLAEEYGAKKSDVILWGAGSLLSTCNDSSAEILDRHTADEIEEEFLNEQEEEKHENQ